MGGKIIRICRICRLRAETAGGPHHPGLCEFAGIPASDDAPYPVPLDRRAGAAKLTVCGALGCTATYRDRMGAGPVPIRERWPWHVPRFAGAFVRESSLASHR